jgi:hypothetical protein
LPTKDSLMDPTSPISAYLGRLSKQEAFNY